VPAQFPQPDAEATTLLEEVVGYLNFSSGTSDPSFLRNVNQLFRALESDQPREESFSTWCKWLRQTIERLHVAGGAFADVTQASAVVELLQHKLLPADREFHSDLLFHQTAADLLRPFSLGRACEALLLQGSPWDETERIVEGALAELNDFVGYRPVATLTSGDACDPYPHEFVRPIPLYIRDAGVAVGRYEKLIRLAIEILQSTDEEILARAWFDLDRLEEIALDPRAYDFDHPVNRRPNYHFGMWDPHQISNAGYYTRFVLQQITLDSLLVRCQGDPEATEKDIEKDIEDKYQEAATVLAGTMLMASGTSGDGPGRHDSTVTLSTLLPQIAAYRDDFYQERLTQAQGSYGQHLVKEAQRSRQPFGGARQHLNRELARRRALQLQRVHLAHLYARLGYPEAAQQQADLVRVPSARMISEVYCRLTAGHDAIDKDQLQPVLENLLECEKLVHRAIECGALVDPWNIVGFAGNFSLFPALENTVHDWRVDELIELVEQILDLNARAWSEAAAIDDSVLEKQFEAILERLSTWWDRYATSSVEDVKRLVAKEIEVSANLVSGALNAWHKAGAAAGDIGFWRMFVEQFDSSKAFQLVIEALLDHGDTVAAMALMMQWVSQKDRTPLEEGDSSFHRLAFHWLTAVEAKQSDSATDSDSTATTATSPTDTDSATDSATDLWPQVEKFFAYLEANAEEFWQVPSMTLDESLDSMFDEVLDDIDGAVYFEDDDSDEEFDEDDEEDSGGLFEAAYEKMIYQDSTDDGIEGDLADDSIDWEYTEWEYEVQRLEQRLDFLTTVASLWKHAVIVWGAAVWDAVGQQDPARAATFQQWLTQAGINYGQLIALLETVHSFHFELPSGTHDSLVEYDRLRTTKEALVQKIIITSVETADAARLLAAAGCESTSDQCEAFSEPLDACSIKVLRAILAGDAEGVRSHWDELIATLKPCALLYVPHSRGGKPRQIVSTRGLQKLLHDLLGWLPQLGLISQTCELLDLAQEMETEHPVGQGAVTEFDRLFESGYQAIVRSMVASAESWETESPNNISKNISQEQQSAHADHLLVDALQQLTERQLERWLKHSRTLRLNVVERLAEPKSWQRFVKFIERFGGDLFDQKSMSLGNLRGILHQGVDSWLESLEENPDVADEIMLIEELDKSWSRQEAVEILTLAIESVVENYRAYRDYNTTTTQSDRGELLYTLIDFLRLRAAYDRVAWNLKPVIWAHEILIRHRRAVASEMWCLAFAQRTAEAADGHQSELQNLSQQHGMLLATVADRISERFVRPLLIDRVKALLEPALTATGDDRAAAFTTLEREISSLSSEPSGAGLDLPDWLAALEDEVTTARSRFNHQPSSDRLARHIGQVRLTWQELLEQLEETS